MAAERNERKRVNSRERNHRKNFKYAQKDYLLSYLSEVIQITVHVQI